LNKTPTINDDCSIKSREAFFEELESVLSKNRDKTVILAMHHPLMSNGSHGGQFSIEKQIFPLEQKNSLTSYWLIYKPTKKNDRGQSSRYPNKQYTAYVKRIKTLLQSQDNVIVVSGHDHNLQFIDKDNIKQIISGAGSKSTAARAINPNDFSYGKMDMLL
jgi:hypothetical protein